MAKTRKIPMRKCLVTNEMRPKKELIRVVKNKEGEVFVDTTGKKNGRGAYLSRDITIIDKAEKSNILNNQLSTVIDSSIYEELRKLVANESKK